MYPVEFASETARHTLDLSTAQNKAWLLKFSTLCLFGLFLFLSADVLLSADDGTFSQLFGVSGPHIPGIKARALFLSALPSRRAVL